MLIRPAEDRDREAIWSIIGPVIRAGESYALDRDLSEDQALAFWMAPAHETFVAEDAGDMIGTYFLKRNQAGGGGHVCNCGYATSARATGKGVARAMCGHSLDYAKARGFEAMQFNFVISTNVRAVALWQAFGFDIVGRLPGAFRHPSEGEVDALVMYRRLD